MKPGISAGLIIFVATLCPGQTAPEPHHFFQTEMGLSDEQIATISRGKPVVKVLPSKNPGEIIVFGAVFVEAAPEAYPKLAFDMDRLRRSPSYLGVRRFSDPPVASDLEGFSLEPEDVRNLKSCRPGNCGVQLPADAMQEIQRTTNWSGPDHEAQVNEGVRRMALSVVKRYQADGNRVLGSYHDREHPFDVDTQLRSLLARSQALTVYLPELNRYLLEYPKARPAHVDSLFFWEKVNFGLKPTLRLNHAIAYHSDGPKGTAQVVVVKQLYASHYLQLAIDLTACVRPNGRSTENGFYLITIKGSNQHGLTGWKGALMRLIIVSKTRSTQERLLLNIKQGLEEKR